jgi:hypothetical protein
MVHTLLEQWYTCFVTPICLTGNIIFPQRLYDRDLVCSSDGPSTSSKWWPKIFRKKLPQLPSLLNPSPLEPAFHFQQTAIPLGNTSPSPAAQIHTEPGTKVPRCRLKKEWVQIQPKIHENEVKISESWWKLLNVDENWRKREKNEWKGIISFCWILGAPVT